MAAKRLAITNECESMKDPWPRHDTQGFRARLGPPGGLSSPWKSRAATTGLAALVTLWLLSKHRFGKVTKSNQAHKRAHSEKPWIQGSFGRTELKWLFSLGFLSGGR